MSAENEVADDLRRTQALQALRHASGGLTARGEEEFARMPLADLEQWAAVMSRSA